MKDKLKITVLMGGTSAERDVSLASGEAIVQALREAGHQAIAIDTAKGQRFLENQTRFLPQGVKSEPPDIKELQRKSQELTLKTIESFDLNDIDVIFLALHGGTGEDGTIQALLDLTGKPYTGSGMLASALAMNKSMAKKIFEREGILIPKWLLLDSSNLSHVSEMSKGIKEKLGFPVVVKPDDQGSTVGFSKVDREEELASAIELAQEFSDKILIEEFVEGRELTVAILDDLPLPVVEIVPEHGIYDYQCKYTKGKSRYICPADLSEEKTKEIQRIGLKAFKSLGCEDYARVDFRYSSRGTFYCLEVNSLPGMTATSLVPMAAKQAKIDFPELVDRIVKMALRKKGKR
ncbi:MAG: D-alanine--D-alanine ligase [Candidatus Zixiibacteriota bacterium]